MNNTLSDSSQLNEPRWTALTVEGKTIVLTPLGAPKSVIMHLSHLTPDTVILCSFLGM